MMIEEMRPSRRMLLLGAGSTLLIPRIASALTASAARVTTAQGIVQGSESEGVTIFKGLRYGASTAGAGRFRAPRPPLSWDGVFDATTYGDQAPQVRSMLADPGPMSEDCLRINIWTPRADAGRRPVMLWLHGGGFEAGSGSAQLYDGTNLARRGDVVVATINHRLNVFGHCHLAQRLGSDYAVSGNVGFLDLLAAMRWVKQNIAAFGGDPENVTIFGQSGGGRKVSLSYASPAAEGLFARGIVQSGSHLLVQTPEQADRLTGLLLAKLGYADGAAEKLLSVPVEELIAAQREAIGEAGYRFEPVLDGITFTEQPFLPAAPRWSAAKPMMLGSTRTELSAQLGAAEPRLYDLPEALLPAAIGRFVGHDKAAAAIDIFRKANPDAPAPEIFFAIASARAYGRDATLMAEARTRAPAAGPTWLYKLAWRSPAEGGRRITPHSLDLPFVFDNVAAGARLAGPPTDATRAMTDAMANSWIAFARSGNPDNPPIPHWTPYDLEKRTTMIFDVPPRAEADPWQEERMFMDQFETTQGTAGRYRGLAE
ncbi:carboxylesterase/lipase family protein [Sphingopyxis sp. JAI128]|uniref:carboxylesterase/lipase family protein n=1 Tax=Sphingopyxis sp. JAI128 TaxID=2723066 RepID=UPI00161FEB11|nr:carboxylesterase family protein [Sphingopyxis sp. JAI128]MBB6426714.1 para-nitrobenzyl esterase [Sphingopyxis sp. JAI128]